MGDAAENVGAQPQLLIEAMHGEWLWLCRDRQMLHSRPLVHKCSVRRTPNLNDSAKLMNWDHVDGVQRPAF